MNKQSFNQLREAYIGKCCVCDIANCSAPIAFSQYCKMSLTDVEKHLGSRELITVELDDEEMDDDE